MADPWQIHGRSMVPWWAHLNHRVPKDGWFASTRASRREYEPLGRSGKGSDLFQIPKMGLGNLWKFQEQVNYSELIRTSTFLICGHVSILLSPVRVRELDGSKSMRRIWSPQHQLLLRMATRTPWRPKWQHPGNGRNPNDMAWKWIIYIYICIYIYTQNIYIYMSICQYNYIVPQYIMTS